MTRDTDKPHPFVPLLAAILLFSAMVILFLTVAGMHK